MYSYSELDLRLQENEDKMEQLKQTLREATAKYQNLMKHLKLVEGRTNHANYEEQLRPSNHLDGLHKYSICYTYV